MVDEDEMIPVRTAAKVCGRTAETVRRWIWEGKLPAQKRGNQLFVRRSDALRVGAGGKAPDKAARLAALEEAIAIADRIYERMGPLHILEALDRSRESHP